MKIESIGVTPVFVKIDRVVRGSSYTIQQRATVIVEVRTSDGVVGRIYSGDEKERLLDLAKMIEEVVAPRVIGRDLHSVEAIWKDLMAVSAKRISRPDQKIFMEAVAAVDIAIWDAIGKTHGVPLYKLWGGARDSVPVIVIGGYYEDGKTLDQLVEEVRGYRELGAAGVKLKVGGLSPKEDLARFRAVREGMGPDFVIACDANRAWSVDEAVEFARGADGLNMRWFEEPVHWYDDARYMAEVRRRTSIPVCAGQSEFAPHKVRRLIDDGAVDLVNFDASWGGGPTGWRKIASYAELVGVDMAHHEEIQTASHLLCSVPNGTYVEIFHPSRDPILFEMTDVMEQMKDGYLHMRDRPGLGLEFDESFIKRHKV